MSATIQQLDEPFFKRIIDDSVACGYIKSPWQGRDIEHLKPDSIIPSCTICCISGGGREDDKGAVVLSIALFVVSFFVGLFYLGKSIQSAARADRDLKKAESYLEEKEVSVIHIQPEPYSSFTSDSSQEQPRSLNSQPPPPYNVQFYVPQPFYPQQDLNPSSPLFYKPLPGTPRFQEESSYPREQIDPNKPLYEKAVILLKGRREERIKAAVSQGFLTAGAGLITVALLITLISKPNFTTIIYGTVGGGAVFTGAIIFIVKEASTDRTEAQEAADSIASTFTNEFRRFSIRIGANK